MSETHAGPYLRTEFLRAGSPRAAVRNSRGPERVLAVLLVATAGLALVAVAALVVPPALRVTRYEISGNAAMTRDEVLASSLIHDKEYFFSLEPERVRAALTADPRVASATVTKFFPNGLKIVVRERRAVAAALVSIDGRAAVVGIDGEGVAFAEADADVAASVPVLSGVRFEAFRMGTRLPPSLAKLTSSIAEIQAAEPALLSAISEIRVVTPASGAGASANAGPIELLIYPLGQHIPVRAAASLDASTLRSIILVLDVLATRGIAATVQEIDFRTGTVVYRTKEGQSG